MTRAATVKVGLCSVCGAKPRGADGRLTRCLDCLKADVDRERQHREAKVREAAR
jgi:GTP cyclohydrolase III